MRNCSKACVRALDTCRAIDASSSLVTSFPLKESMVCQSVCQSDIELLHCSQPASQPENQRCTHSTSCIVHFLRFQWHNASQHWPPGKQPTRSLMYMCLITAHIQIYLFHTTHQIFNCSLEKAHVIWSTISTASTSSTTATATSHTSCGSSGCMSIRVKPLLVSTGHLPIWVRPLITCGLITIGTIKLKKKAKVSFRAKRVINI